MRANCWYGTEKLRVEEVADPHVINPRDAVVRITSSAICGSDLHLYDGFIPTMEAGDILGHEFMGEIVELGPGVKNRKVGDRVVCSFPISCGNCFFCKQELFSLCENSNPNAWMAEQMWGHSPCGIYGYSHMVGGYAGGQAQFVRVPFADVGTIVISNGLTDDQVLFLSDILPTGYMAAEQGDIKPGDTVAVWGAGPVGLFSAKSAQVLGAEHIIVIDRFDYRLRLARQHCNAKTINYEQESVSEVLNEMTGGRGPDVCIDAVGLEGHLPGVAGLYDKLKTNMLQATDRPPSLRQAIMSCRNGGTVSIPGVYGGLLDKMPIGSLVNRSLNVRTGQTHVQHYWGKLLELIENGTIDPTFIITHHLPLDQAPQAYKMFRDKQDECVKVVLRPN